MKVLIKWKSTTIFKVNINFGHQGPNIGDCGQNFATQHAVSYWKMLEIQKSNTIIYEEYIKSSH